MSEQRAKRFNKGKPKLKYVFFGQESLEGLTRVFEFGALKYGDGNWLNGMEYTAVADSLLRHLTAFLNGEDMDPESGLPHVDHVQANAKMLSQYFHTKKEFDDRPDETKK